jgi:hypothetical protein
MTNEPPTLISKVPHGNVSPQRRAATPENQYRAIPPRALPTAIQKYAPISENAAASAAVKATAVPKANLRAEEGNRVVGSSSDDIYTSMIQSARMERGMG